MFTHGACGALNLKNDNAKDTGEARTCICLFRGTNQDPAITKIADKLGS